VDYESDLMLLWDEFLGILFQSNVGKSIETNLRFIGVIFSQFALARVSLRRKSV
jgi:hypothetical protein